MQSENLLREEEQINAVNMSIDDYCNILGITRRTFNNWKRDGKVKVNSRKEVVIPIGKILIITKEVQNEISAFRIEKELIRRSLVKVEKLLADVIKKLDSGV